MLQKRLNMVMGLVLLGVGVIFLAGQALSISLTSLLWPLFVLVPGLLLYGVMMIGGEKAGPFAIPASIVSMAGLLLFYANLFNHWESWAYSWALILPTSIGIGLFIYGTWSDRAEVVKVGTRMAGIGLMIFVGFGFLFEVVIGISGQSLPRYLWTLALIGLGVYLLTRSGEPEAAPVELPPSERPPENGKVNEFEPLDMGRASRGE
ncbi:MAG: hypothetical protein ACFB51_19135 [Anaerolineae bacterium]